ncbi:nuclear transport factor 2 family protein [Ornithinimicrobium ciconiae]|uniref:Nuclear transport factor 2 family protein n=1 Tax=Ornithinimicrobium ciconiae TaxID=2594265 RepID=A0A516G9B1_9MICO|nr:nuclear transport factor 2 family protein [Ornithinimicrobium ciconiae]QDO88117.1 nuclear transport factor 2 family protein [Ornithinimicrobium ciconiae]
MTTTDEQQLRDLEDARYQAMERGDADAVAALCHPDLTYAHSNGARDSLETLVKKIADKVFVYGPIDHPIAQVIINGSTGVVVGGMRARVEVNGEERNLNNTAIAVWARGDAGWRLVAYQPTPLLP